MLTLFDRDARGNRRSFLKLGGSAAIGAAGVSLSDLAALRARAETIPGVLTGKSVIFCPIDNLGHAIWNDAAKAAWQFFTTF